MAKTSQLQIRVSEKEKALLREAAEREGMDLSSYVLSRTLPDERRQFRELVESLRSGTGQSASLAALSDLLTALQPARFAVAVAEAPGDLPPWESNYVAAMVETAANRKNVAPPRWVRDVEPLPSPWFASSLVSLRLHLLRSSPAAFRRRNLFVDATLGDRV